ncbi:MAG: hypothetical protein IPI73_14825 [Betaproteobacteria bacterium]|nr:hypothetical protein [Betaproteobacteria bacterium]
MAPPLISKAFGAASIPLNGSTSLSFTVQNSNATVALTGIAFTDTLPAGLVVATPNGLTNTCGGTATATAGSNAVSLSGGSVAASASCTLSINVTGIAAGDQNNTTGNVTSANGGNGNAGSASTTVVAPPTIAKSFSPISLFAGGQTTLTFTLTNPAANAVALTGVGFTDIMPVGLGVPTTSEPACGGTRRRPVRPAWCSPAQRSQSMARARSVSRCWPPRLAITSTPRVMSLDQWRHG